jgi:hypothetical protein
MALSAKSMARSTRKIDRKALLGASGMTWELTPPRDSVLPQSVLVVCLSLGSNRRPKLPSNPSLLWEGLRAWGEALAMGGLAADLVGKKKKKYRASAASVEAIMRPVAVLKKERACRKKKSQTLSRIR